MKTKDDYEFEKAKEECTFTPKINQGNEAKGEEQQISQIKGVDKVMERLAKARQIQLEKKLMTERGMPSQLVARLGQPEPSMAFGSNKDKFKSGFGIDGSQIIKQKSSSYEFSAS